MKVRDQHEVPSVAEKHTMLARCRNRGLSRIGLKSDGKDAHRTFKVHRKDHATQACRLMGTLILNQVGTQGINSSAYWWARIFGIISRLVLYLMLDEEFWVLTYADDQDFMASGPNAINNILLALLLMTALRVPCSWKKSAGRICYDWIGYAQDLGRFRVGISESRAA